MQIRTGWLSEPSVRHANAACDHFGDVPNPIATLATSAPPFCAGRSPSRSRLHLMLVLLKLPFGILITWRFLSRTEDLSNVNGTPKTQCPNP